MRPSRPSSNSWFPNEAAVKLSMLANSSMALCLNKLYLSHGIQKLASTLLIIAGHFRCPKISIYIRVQKFIFWPILAGRMLVKVFFVYQLLVGFVRTPIQLHPFMALTKGWFINQFKSMNSYLVHY
jgi:hypothetical protein